MHSIALFLADDQRQPWDSSFLAGKCSGTIRWEFCWKRVFPCKAHSCQGIWHFPQECCFTCHCVASQAFGPLWEKRGCFVLHLALPKHLALPRAWRVSSCCCARLGLRLLGLAWLIFQTFLCSHHTTAHQHACSLPGPPPIPEALLCSLSGTPST